MPQMAPMNWMLFYMIFTMIFFFFYIFIFFNFFENKFSFFKKKNTHYIKTSWKW